MKSMVNNFNSDEIRKLTENLNEKNVRDFAEHHLSENEKRQLNEILSDKNKLKDIMNSPQAKELMKKFGGRNG